MPATPAPPRLLGVREVAELLNVSRPQVYRLLEHGLPYLRLHRRGDLRFDPRDVAAWVESRKSAMTG